MLIISTRVQIPENELLERFVRSSGPGGQNVNKVATAVELRFDVQQSPSLPETVRERLLAAKDRRLTAEGIVVIQAQRYRSQERNRQDARDRLSTMIKTAMKTPKKRIASKPGRGAIERRLGSKRERAQIKRQRNARGWDGH